MTQTNYIANNSFKFPKYLTFIVGLYCIFFILPTILLNFSIVLPFFGVIPISILFTGTYFVLLDVITEVYGYYEARKALYTGLISYTIIVFVLELVSSINANIPPDLPAKALNNHAYFLLFNNIYQTWFSVVLCTLVFDTLNIKLLSKWKFLLKGKFFILRSLGASSFAIILFSLITNLFAFHQQILNNGLKFYIDINIISIAAKILCLAIFSIPAMMLAKFLIKVEQLEITFNPNLFFSRKESK